MLSHFAIVLPIFMAACASPALASCVNDNLLLVGTFDTGCDLHDPICVGSSFLLLNDESSGSDCAPCVNTQEIDGLFDLGCDADQPRCMTLGGSEPEWNQAGAYCAAELPLIEYCINDGAYAARDTYCTEDAPICVTSVGALLPADVAFPGNCCAKCVNTQQSDAVADNGCPADRPRCVLENMATPDLNTAGDLCKENPVPSETQVGLCDTFDDATTIDSDWTSQLSGILDSDLQVVDGAVTINSVETPFAYNYVAADTKENGRRMKADVTLSSVQPDMVGVHFLQKEDHPLYLTLWLDPSMPPGAYVLDGAFVVNSVPFGFPTANLGTSFSLEAAINGKGDMTLIVTDFPANSALAGQTLTYDLGVYSRHMDTLELTGGISTDFYSPDTSVSFDNFSHTGCGGVQHCINTNVHTNGSPDMGCSQDEPVCVKFDGNGQLFAHAEGKKCARCINNLGYNLPYVGWADEGCPPFTPTCVQSDGVTNPALHYAGEMCV